MQIVNSNNLTNITLSDEQFGPPLLADIHWGDVNLAVIEWSQIKILGDESIARQIKHDGKMKERKKRLEEHENAARANRQLSVTLQAQGLIEAAAHFAYRAQLLRRWSFLAYLLIIGLFMLVYHWLDPYLLWNEAFVVSMTAFHGRGFSPSTFTPGDPVSLASTAEAFVGLIIEVTFIATLTQRFFNR